MVIVGVFVVIWDLGRYLCLLVLLLLLMLLCSSRFTIGISVLFQAAFDVMLLWSSRCPQSVSLSVVIANVFVISVIIMGALVLTYSCYWYCFLLSFVLLDCFKLCLSFSHKYVGLYLSLLLVYG